MRLIPAHSWFPRRMTISEDGRDFISRLVEMDRSKRLTAKEALQHPWIKKLATIVNNDTGIKDVNNLVSDVNLKMNNIISVNAFGEYMHHPDQEATITLRRDQELTQVDISSYITTYPNPTSDIVNVRSEKVLLS